MKNLTEEPKQIKCYCGHTTTCDCSPLESKQETLEEAANKYFNLAHSRLVNNQQKEYEKELFFAGAKWQQERMYSEEEVLKILESHKDILEFDGKNFNHDEWFEQFKKK